MGLAVEERSLSKPAGASHRQCFFTVSASAPAWASADNCICNPKKLFPPQAGFGQCFIKLEQGQCICTVDATLIVLKLSQL